MDLSAMPQYVIGSGMSNSDPTGSVAKCGLTAPSRRRTVAAAPSGMKTLLAFTLATLGCLVSAQADIPAPRPISITVSNISAFPQYKFSYRSTNPKDLKAIVDGQTFNALESVELLIQGSDEPWQTWEVVPYNWRGGKVNIKVEGVKREGKQVSVTFKASGDGVVPSKKSAAAQWVPLFTLAGMSTCALVVFARQRTTRKS